MTYIPRTLSFRTPTIRSKTTVASIALCLMMGGGTVFAQDDPTPEASDAETLGAEYCTPAGGIIETLAKFDSLKATKRDTVGPDLTLALTLEESEPMPDGIELRDGDTVLPVRFDGDYKSIGFTDQIRQLSEAGELCILDPSRADRTRDTRGFTINMGMGVRFKETPGTHSMAQIEDAMKDGRSHYKKMAGAMGFMVPKFDYIAVAGDDAAAPPRIWATANGADLSEPEFELYDDARMVSVDALEALGADGVRIEGGPYRISPSPDAKTVAKFSE